MHLLKTQRHLDQTQNTTSTTLTDAEIATILIYILLGLFGLQILISTCKFLWSCYTKQMNTLRNVNPLPQQV